MFCDQCGNSISPAVNHCPFCGAPVRSAKVPASFVGFSPKINDPAFSKYKAKFGLWSIIFSCILAIIAIIGFPIYGQYSGELEFPKSLFYGMGIGGMFILIALLQLAKRGLDKTWDGTVIDKKSYRRRVNDSNDSNSSHYETVYEIKIKKDSGGTKKHKTVNLPGLYDYYNVGDLVRHHKGFQYYEKFDKSRDSQILCAACLSFNNIQDEACRRCKCPLLK
jgi:hypothetical protein